MMKMARPRKARPGEDPAKQYWLDDPERREALYEYCKQDVIVERAIHNRIGCLSPEEQTVRILDPKINDRGLHIDAGLIGAAIRIAKTAKEKISAEIEALTEGAVTTVNQTQRLMAWLEAHGCKVPDVQKETLRRALTRKDIPQEAKRVMELRLDGAHASANKFETMLAWANDNRIHGAFKYHGASTGRWTSLGVQLQNMKRPLVDDLGAAIDAVASRDFEHLRGLYPQPMSVLGDVARATICAQPGHRRIIADFSGLRWRARYSRGHPIDALWRLFARPIYRVRMMP